MRRDAVRREKIRQRAGHHRSGIPRQQRCRRVESFADERMKQRYTIEFDAQQSTDGNRKNDYDALHEWTSRSLTTHMATRDLRQQDRWNEAHQVENDFPAERGCGIQPRVHGVEIVLDQHDVSRTEQSHRDRRCGGAETADHDAPPIIAHRLRLNLAIASKQRGCYDYKPERYADEKPEKTTGEREPGAHQGAQSDDFQNAFGTK